MAPGDNFYDFANGTWAKDTVIPSDKSNYGLFTKLDDLSRTRTRDILDALKDDPKLDKLKGFVQDSGEGRWMIADAIEKDVPVPTLTTALFTRFRSRQDQSFAEKMLAALRNAFGGHAVRR